MNNILSSRKIQFLFVSILILIDQSTKIFAQYYARKDTFVLIPKLINFNLVRNYGASFGILSNQTIFLSFISIFVSISLVIWIYKKRIQLLSKQITFIFLLAGTVGNGIDRWTQGYVIDFIELAPINFPVFNFADIYINIALIAFLVQYIFPNLIITKIIDKKEY